MKFVVISTLEALKVSVLWVKFKALSKLSKKSTFRLKLAISFSFITFRACDLTETSLSRQFSMQFKR